MRRRRLLTISHSYVVTLNRRFASELARAGGDDWEVTAVAPTSFKGDLRHIDLERDSHESSSLRGVPAHLTKHLHLFTYGRALAQILREDWDMIHMWEEPYVAAGAQIAYLARPGVPLVFSTFQNIRKRYPSPFRQFERFVLRRSSGWIAFGETIADALARGPGYRDLPMTVIPPGVDTEKFRPNPAARARVRAHLGWHEAGPPVVGYLGRLISAKGVTLLCAALEQAREPWRALFVGGGDLEREIRAWGARFGDRVRVVSAVPHDEVPDYLNAMDVLCAPSQTTPGWREQFGRMLVEAFACGVPVIASKSGEIPHVVGSAGLLVAERDESAWAQAIRQVIVDESYRAELSVKGRERAAARFAWAVVARDALRFFGTVAKST